VQVQFLHLSEVVLLHYDVITDPFNVLNALYLRGWHSRVLKVY